jgi:hypothetical protein
MSPEAFTHDVFLSHSTKDKAVVRPLAERLRKARPELQPSAFILQPFPDAPIKGALAQFPYINWRSHEIMAPTRRG